MKQDEFAFLNLQLAGMLRSGIPLEGALRQLCSTMRRGSLRAELQALEADLAQGISLKEALPRRRLPELYRKMVEVGVAGNDLPGVLTMLADYYHRSHSIWSRLKGLMVYPMIVLSASLVLSVFIASMFRGFAEEMPNLLQGLAERTATAQGIPVMVWTPVIFLSLATLGGLFVLLVPPVRRSLRWRLPGFKEAGLAQVAAILNLMLKSGTPLSDAIGLLHALESKSPLGRDVAQWQSRLAEGRARFPDMAAESKIVPPLFHWLVDSGGEDLTEGFRRTSEIYQARAVHRIELLLYAVLPVSILFLGAMLVSQVFPLIQLFVHFGRMLDQLGA